MSEPLPRRRNNDNNSPHGYEDRMSPPRRQRLNDDDRSSSPPRRQRERSESPPIPLRRRIVNDEDRSPSPPRPPRRQILNDNDRSPSPPRRQRERSESPPIPLRRRIVNDEDRSPSPPRPPRRQRERSESPPILRQRHTMNDRSPSPPRGREMMGPANTTTTTRETSLSPIRRRRTAASHSRSPSPPRHHSSRRDEPISPPRNRAMNDHTPSSPRRQPPQSSRHIIHGGTIRPRQYSTSPPPGAMRKRGNDGEPFFPTDTGMTAQANPQQPAPMSLPPQSAPPQKTTTVLRDKHGNALSTQQLEQLELFMAEQAEEEKQKSQQQDSARSKTQKLTIDTLHKIKEYKERMINKASTTGQDQTLYGAGLAQYKQHIKDTVLKVMGKDRFRDPARRLRADLSKDQHAQILTEDPLWLEQRKQEELEIIAAEQKAQRKEYERAHKLQRAHAAALEAGDEKEAEIIQNKIAQRAQEEYEDAMNAIRVEAVAVDFRVVRHPITGEVLKRVKKPTYEGAASWPNRFGIKPGYRWDGVDRSNHWEDVRKDVLRKGKQ